jgi:hypothetical protein
MNNESNARDVYADIRAERERQDEQWGGPEHDDEHGPADWLHFIDKQIIAGVFDVELGEQNPGSYRARLVKTAALAVAAIESHDRKSALNPEAGNG